MRWFRFAVLILVVTVLQDSLLSHLAIRPDLLMVLLVFFAIYAGGSDAVISSFTIGFAADIIGPAMGPQMISFGLVGTLLAYLRRMIVIRKMPYQALTILVAGFLAGVLAYFLGFLKDRTSAPDIYSVLFSTSLCSAIVGPFLFLPSAWWMGIRTHRYRRY
jgi:rod shape-determining protein MreD